MYKEEDFIACDLFLLDENEKSFPKKIIKKKTILQESCAESMEIQPENLILFAKYENFYKIFGLESVFKEENPKNIPYLTLSFNPLSFYQMKYSKDIILCFQRPLINSLPILAFKAYDYNAKFLNSFNLVLKKNKGLEILDVYGKKLFFKQFHDELIIINLMNGETYETKGFITPKSIEFFHDKKNKGLILCFYVFGLQLWDFYGKKVAFAHFDLCEEKNFFIDKFIGIFYVREKNKLFSIDINEFKHKKQICFLDQNDLLFPCNNGSLFIHNKNMPLLIRISLY